MMILGNSQQGPNSHVREQVLQFSPELTIALANTLIMALRDSLSQRTGLSCTPFMPLRKCEIINLALSTEL